MLTDMRVILLESPHSRETAQCATGFIPVQNAKVGKAKRQFLVAPFL